MQFEQFLQALELYERKLDRIVEEIDNASKGHPNAIARCQFASNRSVEGSRSATKLTRLSPLAILAPSIRARDLSDAAFQKRPLSKAVPVIGGGFCARLTAKSSVARMQPVRKDNLSHRQFVQSEYRSTNPVAALSRTTISRSQIGGTSPAIPVLDLGERHGPPSAGAVPNFPDHALAVRGRGSAIGPPPRAIPSKQHLHRLGDIMESLAGLHDMAIARPRVVIRHHGNLVGRQHVQHFHA